MDGFITNSFDSFDRMSLEFEIEETKREEKI